MQAAYGIEFAVEKALLCRFIEIVYLRGWLPSDPFTTPVNWSFQYTQISLSSIFAVKTCFYIDHFKPHFSCYNSSGGKT